MIYFFITALTLWAVFLTIRLHLMSKRLDLQADINKSTLVTKEVHNDSIMSLARSVSMLKSMYDDLEGAGE